MPQDKTTEKLTSEKSSAPDWSSAETHPKHIAIIMDGNQRWAKARGLPGVQGHQAGAKVVKRTLKACVSMGVKVLTLFAFSSENWRRPASEVAALMGLFLESLQKEVPELMAEGVKLNFFGDLDKFDRQLREHMLDAMTKTQENGRIQLNVAVNYGGRWDMVQAARDVAQQVLDGRTKLEDINETKMQSLMCLNDCPPVDLCIRTSGEQRISNFLLWQLAYAELMFIPTYWPDFNEHHLKSSFELFARRQRRFGRTPDQIHALAQKAQSDLVSTED